jgi:hypothetical protein
MSSKPGWFQKTKAKKTVLTFIKPEEVGRLNIGIYYVTQVKLTPREGVLFFLIIKKEEQRICIQSTGTTENTHRFIDMNK